MKRYGYHRTSTREQHLDRGIKEITAYCEQNSLELEKIFTDQQTGKNFNRPRYQVLKEDVLRTGDELIITEVDRLGRNKQETLKELQYYRDNGIRVKILELPTTLMNLSKLDNAMARMLMETINNMLIKPKSNYCTGEEQFTFFKLPKCVMDDMDFLGLPVEAKPLYAIFLDRVSLSIKNGWVDENGRVFIYYSVRNICEILNCGTQKACKLLDELEGFGAL